MSDETLTNNDVLHMAELSRLTVSPAETTRFKDQFAAILDYMKVLEDIDVTGIEPLYWPSQHPFLARPDQAVEQANHEAILANAPEADDTYFIVPRIV